MVQGCVVSSCCCVVRKYLNLTEETLRPAGRSSWQAKAGKSLVSNWINWIYTIIIFKFSDLLLQFSYLETHCFST